MIVAAAANTAATTTAGPDAAAAGDEAGRSAVGVFKTSSGRSKADDMSINPLSICLNLLQCTTLSGRLISRKQA